MKKIIARITSICLAVCLLMTAPCVAEPVSAASAPAKTKILEYSITDTSLDLRWQEVSGVTGYQIEYADNRFFLGAKRKTIASKSTGSYHANLDESTLCYIRIRTYITDKNKRTTYSAWVSSSNCNVSKEAIINQINSGSKPFELTSAARQSIGKYDTLQGGCAYKNTGWFILYNRKVSRCKIVKVDMKTMKVLQVSRDMPISHGNSMTYNPHSNVLVVAHGPNKYRKVSVINPSKLKIINTVNLKVSSSTPGITKKYARKFKGITSIAYNADKKLYVGRVKGYNHLLMLNSSLKPVKYIRLKYGTKQLYQGICSFDNKILVAQSPNKYGRYNQVLVYDWNGNYQSTVRFCKRYELETVFQNNGELYAGYYTSYYKTYYLEGFRIKVYKGRKDKIKTLFKYTKLMRENYLFKVTDL